MNKNQLRILTAVVSITEKEPDWKITIRGFLGNRLGEPHSLLLEEKRDGTSEIRLFRGDMEFAHAIFSNSGEPRWVHIQGFIVGQRWIEPLVNIMRDLGHDPKKIEVIYGEDTRKLLSDFLEEN